MLCKIVKHRMKQPFTQTLIEPQYREVDREIKTKRIQETQVNFDKLIGVDNCDCVICSDKLKGQQVVVLPCGSSHVFHTNCIENWLLI